MGNRHRYKLLTSLKAKEAGLGIAFIAPSLAGFLLFFFLPYIKSLFYCFTQGVNGSSAGFENFIDLFQSEPYWLALKNTLIFVTAGIPSIMLVSFTAALLLKGAPEGLIGVVIVPMVLPAASVIVFYKVVFDDYGIINQLLSLCGISSVSFLDSGWSAIVLVAIYIWKYFGYNAILFLTALESIPKQYYECAMLDGAGRVRRLLSITIPFCAPMSFFVFIMSFVNSFKIFRETILLFGIYPGDEVYTIQHFMNNNFFNLSYQRLSTAAFIMIIFIVLLVWVCFKLEDKANKSLQA